MKEKSLTIEDGKVQVELANRHNPEDTHLVSLPLDESFYMKQVEETAKLTQSQVKAGGSQALEGINRAMAVYGIAAGFLGAGKFFAENDTARGAITLTQSLHGLGEMGGLNQQLSRMSQDIFQKALHQAAGELGVEKTIAKISSSVERFGESAAGQFLKDIPIVGLGFQGYFIAEDAIAIRKINRSDPEQNKYFGLQVTNLVLDVSTTVLTIAEVAFPPAAIILEPIVIGLTIARMAISDFYCDVVSELDKLPQGAGDFDKMVAVIAGLEEGAVDFVTGGLLREIDGLEKEQRQNRELLHKLSTPESYYKIIASNGNVSALDLMEGTLSQYGGFVTVRLSNNGNVMIQVGGVDDGQGGVRTIQKSFHNPSIQNIVLGVGESSKFLYTEKAAHLCNNSGLSITALMIDLSRETHGSKVNLSEPHRHLPYVITVFDSAHDDVIIVLSIDTSTSTKSCNISCAEGGEYLKASHIYGARDFSNYITGGRSSTVITGGSKPDYLHGNDGNERIEGLAGDDIIIGQGGDDVLLGGKGDDDIIGGAGNDMIYGGWGADRIDGGPGVDTVFFSGDVRTSTGVKVNLYSGRGEWADAQNDTYTDIEAVSGTNFNDLIIGDDEDNELVGKFGNDTLVPGHGTDFLFGGPGNDLYILDNCTGVKHINNFASDRALDYILLRDFSPKDACFFLQEGTLVISLTHRNPLLSLIDRDSLTILLDSWSNNSSFYQHVDFVFADDTLVESSFFSTAAEIGPALLELNSTSPTLLVEQVSETAVGIKVETSIGAENTGYKGGSKLQYNLKVSDQLFFSDSQDWTVSLLDSTGFSAGYTYRCDGSCRFQRESWRCSSQIQCRAMCDPYPISNGHTTCSSVLEGEWCSVSCNRLYVLKGPFRIQCRRDGWSSNPYCIESGECGYDYERGPHSVGCLTKLWTEVGCNVEANLSPTKRPDYWSGHYSWTVGEVRSKMAILPNDGFLYNPDCQVDDECFPGRATVLTSEGNRKSMSELRLGDRVLALGADGQLTFSEVILWLDRRPTARERYVLLNTEGSPEPLALSADHVTFIAASNVTPASAASMVPVFAKDLRRGHLLYRHNPATGSLVPRRVTDVRDAEDWGAYAPMTVEGNLIVDGHLASCYALQCRQYFAHLPFAPYRLLQALRSHVPFFADLFPMRREQEDEGVHWYASAWHRVGQWFGYPFGKTCYPTELQLYLYP
ncbi:hypothetical protein MATL_G00252390 [Megalops atlanticus]|uniref:Uncharacterized protein n=1 Tax=Megalops atlanticus TaxID=7932 RepID=A0A9D3P9L1_MEGAT|nr:hypothetical protein MATL_G00252390 [Megalops atlanticus]